MKKKTWIIALCMAICLLFAGCNGEVDLSQVAELIESQQPKGTELGENINLKDIAIEMQNGSTVISMSFLYGSRQAEVPESKISSVPDYKVKTLVAPARLCVELAVDFWDYEENPDWYAAGSVRDVFDIQKEGTNTHAVYFQLKDDVQISTQEQGEKLVITLTPKTFSASENILVVSNALELYEKNLIADELGLTPTKTEGGETMLVSEPQKTREAADSLAASFTQAMQQHAPNLVTEVILQKGNDLPVMNASTQQSGEAEPVLYVNGEPQELEVLIQNGRYLCTLQDGSKLFVRSYLPDYAQDTERVLKERLWIMPADGVAQELGTRDFYSVESAAQSADGQYIAILDSGISNKILYVYDQQSGILHNLGEEGLGDYTVSFVWDAQKPVIYAMTGSTQLQLTKFDFAQSVDSVERVTSLGEIKGAESSLEIRNNKIYYVDKSAQPGGICYSVDLETGERMQVSSGIDFAIAPNGIDMMTVVPSQVEEAAVLLTLQHVNLKTGDVQKIAENLLLENNNYAFSADGSAFYYATPAEDGHAGGYPFAFYAVEMDTLTQKQIGLLRTAQIMTGGAGREAYLIDAVIKQNANNCTTYIYGGALPQ